MVTITVEVNIPQLDRLGEQLMDSLAGIRDALDNLSTTLDTELAEIAAALQAATPTQEAVDAVVTQINGLRDRIANIIPDVPPEPPPAP